MSSLGFDLEVYKDVPGYKGILKAVLKSQIQMLVEQLRDHTGEESVLLTASVTEGTLSHLGSEFGKDFLFNHDEIKAQFLGFCMKRHHKRKPEDNLHTATKRFAASSYSSRDGKGISKRAPVEQGSLARMTMESVISFPLQKKPAYRVHGPAGASASPARPKQFELSTDRVSASGDNGDFIKVSSSTMKSVSGDDIDISGAQDSNRSLNQSPLCLNKTEIPNIEPTGQRSPANDPDTGLKVDNRPIEPETTYTADGNHPVIVKMERDDVDDTVTGVNSGNNIGDNQMFEDRLAPQPYRSISSVQPDGVTMELGNKSYDYVLDQSKETDADSPSCRHDDTFAKTTNGTSKRKQTVPTKLTKVTKQFHEFSNVNNIDREDDDYGYDYTYEAKGHDLNRNTEIGIKKEIKEEGGNSEYHRNDMNAYKNTGVYSDSNPSMYEDYGENQSYYYQYGDHSEHSPQSKYYRDLEAENKLKTPQIDGLLVSRGEGRYEKLIKCEICCKVCRTSNMARHKKKYCLGSPRTARLMAVMKDYESDHSLNTSDLSMEHMEQS